MTTLGTFLCCAIRIMCRSSDFVMCVSVAPVYCIVWWCIAIMWLCGCIAMCECFG